MSSYIHAFLTALRVDSEGEEMSGWVDPSWNRRLLFDNRNDAGPVLSHPSDDDELNDWIEDTLKDYLGVWHDNGDGTFVGQGEEFDPNTGWTFSYSIHFIEKKYVGNNGNGWVEVPYLPQLNTEESMAPAVSPKVFHEL